MKTLPIKAYVKELLDVIRRLQRDYQKRKFTLDGRLVGDIGEMLAEQFYDLELFEGQEARDRGRPQDPIGCFKCRAVAGKAKIAEELLLL